MCRLWLCLVVLFVPFSVAAATDIRNSSDYQKLDRFPSSYIVQYKQEQARDYRLILGGLEKIDGALRAEKEQRIQGNLTQITYRIPENRTANEAFEFFASQIMAQGGDILFRCSGRECGSSNQWANNIFRYFRLYGVDNSQTFASFKMANSYFSLYSVRRGNKRVYLRLDVVDGSDSPKNLNDADESVAIFNEDINASELVRFLEQHPEKLIWLVSYDFNSGTRKEQIERSNRTAEDLKAQLMNAGVDEERVLIHAAGSFLQGSETPTGTKLMVYSENIVE